MLANYLYLHCKPDGTPFYVGEGSMKRAKVIVGARNKLHSAVVDKYGKENILVYAFLCESKDESVRQECRLIEQLRAQGIVLANINNGGIGWLGQKHSIESRAAMSRGKMGKPMSEEHKASIRATLSGKKLPKSHCESLSSAIKNKWQCPTFREKMMTAKRRVSALKKQLKLSEA